MTAAMSIANIWAAARLASIGAAAFLAAISCQAAYADEDEDAAPHPCAAYPLAGDEALECWIADQCAHADGVAERAACVNRIVTWREGALRDINAQTPAFYQGAPSPLRARVGVQEDDGEAADANDTDGDS